MDDQLTEQGPRSAKQYRVVQASALVAICISGLALAVGVYQTRLMQTQARASVWPYVTSGFRYSMYGDNQGFELHLQNNGVGPAIVRSTQIKLDGKPVKHWDEVIAVLLDGNKDVPADAALSGLHGIVIPPSTNRETDVIAIRTNKTALAKVLYEARDRLGVDICYCSVYDDCWISHWLQSEPESVSTCHKAADEFDG